MQEDWRENESANSVPMERFRRRMIQQLYKKIENIAEKKKDVQNAYDAEKAEQGRSNFHNQALRDHSHARIIGNSFRKRAISPSMSFPGFTLTQHHYYQSLLTPCTYKKITKNAALRVMYWYKNGRFWSPLRVTYGCFADVRQSRTIVEVTFLAFMHVL